MNANNLELLSNGGTPSTSVDPDMLDCLLQKYGIAENYIDYSGTTVPIGQRDRTKILAAMGVDVQDGQSVKQAYRQFNTDNYLRLLPTANIIDQNDDMRMSIHINGDNLNQIFTWQINSELGEIFSGTFIPTNLPEVRVIKIEQQDISIREFSLPALPVGYHSIHLSSGNLFCEASVIVTPGRSYEPAWVTEEKNLCGLSVQLYGLRSNRNWGVGDFTDLIDLIKHCASRGIDFLVLNPLHLLDANLPEHCSPYSPMDRRRLNPLYIDPLIELDCIDNIALQQQITRSEYQRRLAKLRAPEFINYSAVTVLKYAVFAKMFMHFKKNHYNTTTERGEAFSNYLTNGGDSLQEFARYQASHTKLSFAQAKDPLFHSYLQWLAETQLESCQQLAKDLGMEIGLIRDMAIGGDANSTEVALNPKLFCLDASVGAPPDPLAPQGQDWGFPPANPIELKRNGYRHFIELLRANMGHCGALRIDHVMGLMRLWWCPINEDGNHIHSGAGAYVFYPVEDLFAILRLESQRQQCLVIGEDLGVVPPEIRSYMDQSGVFSNLLFYFEKYDPVYFKRPQHFPRRALAMIANHDVPTLTAWWNKTDLVTRREIGLLKDEESYHAAIHARESDLIQILHWLHEAGRLPESWHDFNIHRPFDEVLCQAILETNASSSSQLVSTQLEDLCLTESPVNIPGTCTEYPNWRRKLPCCIDDLFNNAPSSKLLSVFVAARQHVGT